MAIRFEEVKEEGHFEKTSFRIRKKIFATMDEKDMHVVLKLNDIDQSVFVDYDDSIFPLPGAWGKKGWTKVNLKTVREDLFQDALTTAYRTVAPKKLADKYKPKEEE
ncbi:MAG: MmcQ/YjbR family DNA-binding protein [Bacteroidia bacterium]|nr:MmcQ/YjbR family DNA-binding protein [Bacteroidia bacterium]